MIYWEVMTIEIINKNELPEMLKVTEFAKLIRVNIPDAYEITKQEGFPLIKLSERRSRIPREALVKWLEKQMPQYTEWLNK